MQVNDILDILPHRPRLTLVDIGAMQLDGGADPCQPLIDAGVAQVIGFEPVPEEHARLVARNLPGRTYLPYAIGDGSTRPFHVCKFPMTSSLLRPNRALNRRFTAFDDLFQVDRTVEMRTHRLDDIAEVRKADFIKIDVQGAELQVFEGGRHVLAGVLMVESEVEFAPLYEGQPLFAEIDQFMRREGLSLHRFAPPVGRPFAPFQLLQEPYFTQVLWTDAIFIRETADAEGLGPERLLKAAVLAHTLANSCDLAAVYLAAYDRLMDTQLVAAYLRRIPLLGLADPAAVAVATVATAPAAAAPAPAPAAPAPATAAHGRRKLHVGGTVRQAGWEVLNALPGPHVDHLGDVRDLSRFADGSFACVYASHVLEHLDYARDLTPVLQAIHRILAPAGLLYIAVPDLDVLCGLICDRTQLSAPERFHVMRMLFGGHMDAYDYHQVGLNEEFLANFLAQAGFTDYQRVRGFGLFNDTSNLEFKGRAISLCVIAHKAP